jgi:hypothetical protein
MNRWRVGEDRGRKEMDRCPLTEMVMIEMAVVIMAKTMAMIEMMTMAMVKMEVAVVAAVVITVTAAVARTAAAPTVVVVMTIADKVAADIMLEKVAADGRSKGMLVHK